MSKTKTEEEETEETKGTDETEETENVTVQTMNGNSFVVVVARGVAICLLKSEIEKVVGTPAWQQKLLIMREGGAMDGDDVPLTDYITISESCTVALIVEVPPEWDPTSDLIKQGVFTLTGPDNSIATKIDKEYNCRNCMMTGPVMEEGKHTISMQLGEGDMGYMSIRCCVVKDGVACDQYYGNYGNTEAWYMSSYDGSLHGNGKRREDRAGGIKDGQVLTMQVDLDAGTLKFWLDGKPHGHGWSSGVTGRLRWATSVEFVGNSVQIVPTPAGLQSE